MPAAWAASAMMSAVSGVTDAGFKTIVFPMMMACAIFQDAMLIGKFQGMIPTQTPIGSRRMYSRAGAKTLPEKGISSSQGNLVAA
jgi:hypothetical protein